MQASNFGGTFDQLFLRILLYNFHRRCLSTCSIPWCKKVENDQKLKSRGGPALKPRAKNLKELDFLKKKEWLVNYLWTKRTLLKIDSHLILAKISMLREDSPAEAEFPEVVITGES